MRSPTDGNLPEAPTRSPLRGGLMARSGLRGDLLPLVALILGSLLLGLALNLVHPRRLPLTLATVKQPGIPADLGPRMITAPPQAAYDALRADPAALLVDVRSAPEYQEIHAEGAYSLPYAEFPRRFTAFVAAGPRDRAVFIYDDVTSRGVAGRLAVRLLREDFSRVTVIEGGIGAWVVAGLPVQMSNAPEPGPTGEGPR